MGERSDEVDGVRNWAGNVTFGAARVHEPTSLTELQDIVASADRCRVVGSAHSFSTVADTTGDLILLGSMPRHVRIDRAAGSVTVDAGIRFGDLASVLHADGLALHNLGSLPHISVAGASATGTHGSGDVNGCLATAVAGVELIDASGHVVQLSRANDPEMFGGVPVSLGTLGIISALTLSVQPTYDVAQVVYDRMEFDGALEHLDDVLAGAYSVSLFTTWRDRVFDQVWVKERTDRTDGFTSLDRWLGAVPADGPRHPVHGMDPMVCTQQLGVPGPWHERLPHFRLDFTPSAGDELQTEYLVPREVAADALRSLDEMRARIAPVLHVTEVRSIAADDLWLSPAYGRASVAIHFTWLPNTDAVAPVVAEIEQRLAPFGPRPHWGKVFTTDPSQVRAAYPRFDDAVLLAQRFDPTAKFRNDFVDTFLVR